MDVEADHVYYVGDLPALVHNNCYRDNLIDRTKIDLDGFDAHHIYPQEFRQIFENIYDIDIDDGENLEWWERGDHQANAAEYNQAWRDFFRTYPNADEDLVEEFAQDLMQYFGF